MKIAFQPSLNLYTKVLKTAVYFSSLCLLLLLDACSKTEPVISDLTPVSNQKTEVYSESQKYTSSISKLNGKYTVDTNVVYQNKNKKTLLALITPEYLDEKSTIDEIPYFIRVFLNDISENGIFDMVNPGEEWKSGIADFGHQVIRRVYNTEKKDSVLIVTYDRNPLPAKQLVYFGIGKHTALFSYYSGGLRLNQHVAIIRFEDNKVVDLWFGNCDSQATITKTELIKQIIISGSRKDKC